MGVLPLCMSVYHIWNPKTGIGSPGTGITVMSCYVSKELSCYPLEEHPVL